MLTVSQSQEWQSVAAYFARHERLPMLMDARVVAEIETCPDAWDAEVRLARYAAARQVSDGE